VGGAAQAQLVDHRVGGRAILPGTGFFTLVLRHTAQAPAQATLVARLAQGSCAVVTAPALRSALAAAAPQLAAAGTVGLRGSGGLGRVGRRSSRCCQRGSRPDHFAGVSPQ
jgi:hypothetical protein